MVQKWQGVCALTIEVLLIKHQSNMPASSDSKWIVKLAKSYRLHMFRYIYFNFKKVNAFYFLQNYFSAVYQSFQSVASIERWLLLIFR